MFKKIQVLFGLAILASCKLLSQDTIKVMEYSLLKYSSGDANVGRYKDLRTIITYANPDVLMVDELDSFNSAKYLLDSALNKAGVGTYALATFFDGNDMDNSMYYKTSKIKFKSMSRITTTLRDINQYYIYYVITPGDTAWVYLHMCHLKAGGTHSTAEGTQRGAEVTNMCNAIASIPQTKNIIFAGDFNFKNNLEPGWIKMTTNCSHLFSDPINQVGSWAGNSFFKNVHTQSSRTSAYPGCCGGTTGGIDDRFDFIMGNNPIINGSNKMKILPNTYKVLGNDGNHFNLSNIEPPANTSVPALVNQALFNMSDHLAITVKILVSSLLVSVQENTSFNTSKLFVAQESTGNFLIAKVENAGEYHLQIIDMVGKNLLSKKLELQAGYNNITPQQLGLEEGIYHAILIKDNIKTSCLYPNK